MRKMNIIDFILVIGIVSAADCFTARSAAMGSPDDRAIFWHGCCNAIRRQWGRQRGGVPDGKQEFPFFTCAAGLFKHKEGDRS